MRRRLGAIAKGEIKMIRTLISSLIITLVILLLMFVPVAFESNNKPSYDATFETAKNGLETAAKSLSNVLNGACHVAYAQERQDIDLPERDEIRQSYQLTARAQVKVSGINGKVEIETSNSNTADVYIVRSARTREDLEYRKIEISQTPNSLTIRGESDKGNWRGRRGDVRQRVILKLPRQVELNVSGVNGYVNVGEVDGEVRVSGINGGVEVAQALGYADISGINGKVRVVVARLGEKGMHVSGINGGIELQFADQLNAELNVSGINGDVIADVPNVVVQGRINRNNFHARIGAGGAPINVSGVNGKLRLATKS